MCGERMRGRDVSDSCIDEVGRCARVSATEIMGRDRVGSGTIFSMTTRQLLFYL